MENQVVQLQPRSRLLENEDVQRGAAFLSGLRMKGWPRKFESLQDMDRAKKIKSSIEAARDYYAQQLAPDTPQALLTRVELLNIRGFQKDLPDAAYEQIQADWIEDLSRFPADLVELACKRWRRSNVNRAPYGSGELMESVKSDYVRRKSIYMNANSVLNVIGGEGAA